MIKLSKTGFDPANSASVNYKLLQAAADKGGDIYIDEPGVRVGGTHLLTRKTKSHNFL